MKIIAGSGSTPKCHGSVTLLHRICLLFKELMEGVKREVA
jgi:hypothetical protein